MTGHAGKGECMDEMNQAEVAREETEQKMLYRFLLMIKEIKDAGKSLDDLEENVKSLLRK